MVEHGSGPAQSFGPNGIFKIWGQDVWGRGYAPSYDNCCIDDGVAIKSDFCETVEKGGIAGFDFQLDFWQTSTSLLEMS